MKQRQQEQIQNSLYHQAHIYTQLSMIKDYISKFKLSELLKMTDDLNRLLLNLNVTLNDFENVQQKISDMMMKF